MSKSSHTNSCPSHGTLVRFLNDDLGSDETRQVELHVEGCNTCQRALESLTPYTVIASARTICSTTFVPGANFLAELRAGLSAQLDDSDSEDSHPPSIPGYQIVRQLGRGGMGVVYLARDERLGRLVALKLLHGIAGGESLRLRLRREAEAVARLRHPNAIQIYEIGETAGRPFLALEFVDGPSLDKAFPEGPVPVRRAAELVERLARAMHVAHQSGIIHRDLKPANILLGADGTPKITDFGLAKLLDEDADGATRSGQLLGTPSYAAPEQVAGLSSGTSVVGPSADVYSLGAILYELLTGRPPFRAAQPLDTLLQVLHQEATPPSKFNPLVPRDLETICLFCLNKSAARRYDSAEALANDLRRFLEGRPVKARPVRLIGRTVRWSRRHPATAALIALAFSTLIAGAGVFAWLWQEAELRAAAQANARTAAEQTAQAEANARSAAEQQTRTEVEARLAADRRTADLKVDHGISLCAQGSVAPGLLGLAEAAASLPPDTDAARVARANLDAWKHYAARRRYDLAHPDEVTGAAFSKDGKIVATACKDGIVRFWDHTTGKPKGPELRHPGAVIALGFRPDGKAVITACRDGAARLWAYPSGEPIGPPMRHDSLTLLAIDPTGEYIATGGDDGKVMIWDAATASFHKGPLEHYARLRALTFSPEGSVLLVGSDDVIPRIWKSRTGENIPTTRKQPGPVTNVAFGPHGMSAIAGPWGVVAQFVVPGTVPPKSAGFSNEHPVTGLLFDPKGRYFVVAVGDMEKFLPRVDLYRVAGNKVEAQPLSTDGTVRALMTSPDGKNLLVTSVGRPPVMWTELEDRPLKITFSDTADGPAAFSPDGRFVATSCRERGKPGWIATVWEIPSRAEGAVALPQTHVNFISTGPKGEVFLAGPKGAQLWHLPTAEALGEKWTIPGSIAACSWGAPPIGTRDLLPTKPGAPDMAATTSIAWVVDGSKVHALDARTGEEVRKPFEFAASVGAFAASRDGRTIALVAGAAAQVIDVETGKVRTLPASNELLDNFAFSLDGKVLATSNVSGTVRLWSVAELSANGEPMVCPAGVVKLAFNPNGTRLAVGCDDNTVVVWDLTTRKMLGSPMVHNSAVGEMVWSPDGSLLATTYGRGMARFWDAATGKQIGPVVPRAVLVAAFTNDGKLLLTGERGQAVRSWHVPQPVAVPAADLPAHVRKELGTAP